MRKLRTVLFVLGVVTLLIVAQFIGCRPHSQGPVAVPVTLATSKNMWCTLPLIAKGKGFFADEGLDVSVTYLDAGRYCMDAVVSKSANFGTVVEVNVAYLAFTGNENVSIVGTVVESVGSAIVARKSAGVQKPEDLKNKKLALSPGTTSEMFAFRFMQKHGIDSASVDLRKVQPLAMQATMVERGADAASTWEPFVFNIRKGLGEDAIVFKDPEAYIGYENVAVSRDWAQSHPELVSAFLRALKKAEIYINEHTEEVQALIAKEINLDLETVKATWGDYKIRLTLDDKTLVDAISAEGEEIRRRQEGYGSKPLPDYKRYVDLTFFSTLSKSK